MQVFLQLGLRTVPEANLTVVELVPGVDGVANLCQGGLGGDMLLQLLLLEEHRLGGLIAFGSLKLLGQRLNLRFQRRKIRALIFHLRKFQDNPSIYALSVLRGILVEFPYGQTNPSLLFATYIICDIGILRKCSCGKIGRNISNLLHFNLLNH